MTFGLLHSSYDLPEWRAVKVTFFVPCKGYENLSKPVTKYKIHIRVYVSLISVLRCSLGR